MPENVLMHSVFRRHFVELPLMFVLPKAVQAQEATDGATRRVSPAVLANTTLTLAGLYQSASRRKLSASQLSAAAAVLRMFFDHLEETGINAFTRRKILSDCEAFTSSQPNPELIGQVRAAFLSAGITPALEDLTAALNPPLPSRLKALQMVERLNSHQLQEQLVKELEAGVRWLPVNEVARPISLRVSLVDADWCAVADWGSAYIGIAALAQTIPGVGLAMGATAVGIWAASKVFC